jgi:hypothetical protein
MEYRDGGSPPGGPPLRELLDRFPGPIAVLATPPDGTTRAVSIMSTDAEPWSIDVSYLSEQNHLLTIRTVRSAEGLDLHALPVEDLATAITNAANREVSVNAESRSAARGQDPESWAQRQMTDSRSLRAEVAGKLTTEVMISVDSIPLTGFRVDAGGWAAVEFQWAGQKVFCSGRPEVIEIVVLRSARAGELP